MKTSKISLLLALVLFLVGMGFSAQAQTLSRKNMIKQSKPKLINTKSSLKRYKWVLVQVYDQQGSMRVSKENVYFQVAEDLKGLGGNGGCNVFGGDLSVTQRVLKIGPIMSTKMYCDESSALENRFLALMDGEKTYRINGRRLTLRDGKTTLVFVARPRERE